MHTNTAYGASDTKLCLHQTYILIDLTLLWPRSNRAPNLHRDWSEQLEILDQDRCLVYTEEPNVEQNVVNDRQLYWTYH